MTMTAIQYRKAIKLVGLSQRSASKFLGVGERTSRRWAKFGVEQAPVAMLLRTMIRLKLKPEEVQSWT